VDAQLGDGLPGAAVLSLPRATIDQACAPGGTVILMGPDPKETLGALFLRLRHAVVEDGVTLIELTSRSTGLSPYAQHSLRPAAGEVDKLAAALVAARSGSSPDTAGVSGAAITAAAAELDGPVTVIVGRPSLAEQAAPTVAAAFALHAALPEATFLSALTRGNVHGALDMGMGPGLLPGRQTVGPTPTTWATAPTEPGLTTTEILAAAADGRIDTLVLLGADPINDFPDHELARRALEAANTVIAVDLFVTDSIASAADIVLAAAAPTEVAGTFTNLEGRVSVLAQKVTPPGTARADWILAAELAFQMGHDLAIESAEDVWAELAQVAPIYAGITLDNLEAAQEDGIVVAGPLSGYQPEPAPAVVTDSYGYRLIATRGMYDTGTMLSHCESSAALAPPAQLAMAPADFDGLGVAAGDSVTVLSSVGTISVPAVPDAGVPKGNVAMITHRAGADAFDLVDCRQPVTGVRVEATR
ncbi:MAG: molybdopterin-dependent oxidoreductase, partial [Acidimicrobiales bacterium]|nr:molybdopterin-dependent oxidoreductase [Acidimicrobiales bacterium]